MLRGVGVESLVLQRPQPKAAAAATDEVGPSLGARFGEQLREASDLIAKAETAATSMASGGEGSVETILALSRAELAMRHVVSVRNRLLESYREVMSLSL
jgi:flagellar hook-basal body complex protein FliE